MRKRISEWQKQVYNLVKGCILCIKIYHNFKTRRKIFVYIHRKWAPFGNTFQKRSFVTLQVILNKKT
jgi:hypothetical protein